MAGFLSAASTLVLLCACATMGMFVRPRLHAAHRGPETLQTIMLITSMLVTLSALVLGLLTTSVKAGYDNAAHNRQEYALQLTQLDQCLRSYGRDGDPVRTQVASYTAAVIASTWPSEPRPGGVSYPDTSTMARVGANPQLASLMHQIGAEIDRFLPSDPVRANLAADCRSTYRDVQRARLTVIEDVRGTLSTPFYGVLVFWLMIVFTSFGLIAPRNSLSIVSICLSAISLSTAIFVIVDLSMPYGGFFAISSGSMRTALGSMMQPSS